MQKKYKDGNTWIVKKEYKSLNTNTPNFWTHNYLKKLSKPTNWKTDKYDT